MHIELNPQMGKARVLFLIASLTLLKPDEAEHYATLVWSK
jgi:hypothetical protein